MKNKNILFLITFLLFGCEEVIDWPVDSDEIRLIVEGRITNEEKSHRIMLTQTADYFNPADPVAVERAIVTVANGNEIIEFNEVAPGVYESSPFAGEVGSTYDLLIVLASPLAGETDFAASSTLLGPARLDSMSARNIVEEDFGETFEYTSLAVWGEGNLEDENGYLIEVYLNDELESDSIDEAVTFDDEFFSEEFVAFELYAIEEPMAEENDSVTLIMHTVERAFIEFHDQLLTESEPRDPFGLSSPPANVSTNISGSALGYFYASSVDTVTAIVVSDLE